MDIVYIDFHINFAIWEVDGARDQKKPKKFTFKWVSGKPCKGLKFEAQSRSNSVITPNLVNGKWPDVTPTWPWKFKFFQFVSKSVSRVKWPRKTLLFKRKFKFTQKTSIWHLFWRRTTWWCHLIKKFSKIYLDWSKI